MLLVLPNAHVAAALWIFLCLAFHSARLPRSLLAHPLLRYSLVATGFCAADAAQRPRSGCPVVLLLPCLLINLAALLPPALPFVPLSHSC